MSALVLIHGAWHGAWCWRRVLPGLRAAGHGAHAVTLTGVGERAHLLRPDLRLRDHIADVLGLIDAEELGDDLVLVGHSYGGLVMTGVADALLARGLKPRHLVYVDAVTPHPGESWSSQHAPETVRARLEAAAQRPDGAMPPPDAAVFGLDGADRDWVNRRQTPQPAGVYPGPTGLRRRAHRHAAAHLHRLHRAGPADDRGDARAGTPRAWLASGRAGHRPRPDDQRARGAGEAAAGLRPLSRARG